MKTPKTLLAIIGTIAVFSITSASAATLAGGLAPVNLDDDAESANTTSTGMRISVFDDTLRFARATDDSPSYENTVSDPLQDYRFFAGNSGTTVASGGSGLISDPMDGIDTDGKPYTTNLWTLTDPGASFSSSPDLTNSGTRARASAVGTIDITGINSGSVFFFYGNNGTGGRGLENITMSGTGADITLTDYGLVTATASGAAMFVSSIDFTHDGDYDTITYTTSSFTYFSGLAVTAVPEPSAFALLAGCFGLTWVMLRRRR